MSARPSPARRAAADVAAVAAANDLPVDGTATIVGPTGPPSAAEIIVDDDPPARVHHPSDLIGATIGVLGVGLMMVLATYAQHTTTGVAEDVQGFADLLRKILVVPVQVLEGAVTTLVPLAVLSELAIRRLGRQVLDALGAAVLAVVLNGIVLWLVHHLGSDDLIIGLSIRVDGEWTVTLPGYVAMLAGLLTVSGPRSRRRTVAWSWNLLWFAIGVLLITAQVSLPGLAISLILGRVAGLAVRFLSGVRSEQAFGEVLVAGVRRAGFEPRLLRRVPEAPEPELAAPVDPDAETTPVPVVEGEVASPRRPDPDAAAQALIRSSGYRTYALTTTDGTALDLVVIDGDRQVVGMLARVWRSLRLRGLEGRSVVNLRQATERAALLAYAVRAAGVRTPQLLAVSEADDSMLLVQGHPEHAVPLAEVDPSELTDELLAEVWAQLNLAHSAGIAHRALTSDTVLVATVAGSPVVWLTGWEQGYVASSELARRMDASQMLALLALRVGATRALDSAAGILSDDDLAAIGPLLQTISLPRRTREEMRTHKQVLAELRTALVGRLPEADVEPLQLVRFGARTVLTIVVPILAVLFIVTQINIEEITQAVGESDWRWSVLAFALGLLTLLGAALAIVAFSPVKIPVWRAVLVQTAATFVALAAPAGIGPAALNLRMLTRRGVSATLAGATVALVQVSGFVVTLALLLVLTVASGNQESALPISPAVLLAIGIVAACVAATLLIPAVRQLVVAKTLPILRQTWPRLIAVLGQPWRLALAVGSNLLMTLGYVLAFDACLHAFGQEASLIQVAIVYLAGNTAGAMVPTPGGMGAIEAALGASLSAVTGINFGIATSIAILFRVVTYWLRIPLGWLAMRILQRSGEL
ncbi:lysylphosphatidylglycerol synthase transmembrane domain-containing protein [Cellulomonas edaphi]|uniref:Lysylphosphatidylglycerol synthase transmembrane domain-containing protein n=1 Tax=Cellulomonas edaphi TaxID=3053468 RepID=A0ABT7S342_9CELL|nr:lysylphosphatidylglycerol synthase transmembrane domain-containing protein [Cellulomons edaphi]MDM7830033.1 lysylphosphatidylglycerol synthase transmembrane domain-containing protein [Cellulomons edaphi]